MVPILLLLLVCQATLLFAQKGNPLPRAYLKCSKEFGYTKDEVYHLLKSNEHSSHSLENDKCVVHCVFEFNGNMKGNTFDWESFQKGDDQLLRLGNGENVLKAHKSHTEIVNTCKENVTLGDNPCQTAYDVHVCFHEELMKEFFLPSHFDCTKEFGFTYDEMYELVYYNTPSGHPVEKDKCIVKCKLDYDGMMKGNEFNWELRLEWISGGIINKTLLKTIEDIIKACKAKVSISDDQCQTAYDANYCLVEELIKIDEDPVFFIS